MSNWYTIIEVVHVVDVADIILINVIDIVLIDIIHINVIGIIFLDSSSSLMAPASSLSSAPSITHHKVVIQVWVLAFILVHNDVDLDVNSMLSTIIMLDVEVVLIHAIVIFDVVCMFVVDIASLSILG
jgi:hypothetical protein